MLAEDREQNCEQRKYWKINKINGMDYLTANLISNKKRTGLHLHHGYAISIVEKGVLPLCFKEMQVYLKPGEFLLLGPEVPHTFNFTDEMGTCLYRTVFIKLDKLSESVKSQILNEGSSISQFYNKELWENYLDVQRGVEQGSADDATSIVKMSEKILKMMPNTIYAKNIVKSESIKQIKEYIKENYMQLPNIEELASIINISPFYLMKYFKNEVGISPHAYINQLRINKAKEMIDEGVSLLEITYELGFTDQAHFSKTFLKATGVNPKNYGGG